MFTGIVQAVGKITSRQGKKLVVSAPTLAKNDPYQLGESIAVNGVCLTLVNEEEGLHFDVSEETYEKTTLGQLNPGDPVNLERAMRPSDRFGGHFVQGHVDQTGTLTKIDPQPNSWVLTFDVGPDKARYLAEKGSICLDGISLTIVNPQNGTFQVAVIPHTWENTNLSSKKQGDAVNVEFDMLTKTVDSLLAHRS